MIGFREFLDDKKKLKEQELLEANLKRFVVKKDGKVINSFNKEFDAVLFVTKKGKKPLEFLLSKGGFDIEDTK